METVIPDFFRDPIDFTEKLLVVETVIPDYCYYFLFVVIFCFNFADRGNRDT